jgi:hypothetical protein
MFLKTAFTAFAAFTTFSVQPSFGTCSGTVQFQASSEASKRESTRQDHHGSRHTITVVNTDKKACDYMIWFCQDPSKRQDMGGLTYGIEDAAGKPLLVDLTAASDGAPHIRFSKIPPAQSGSADIFIVLRGWANSATSYKLPVTIMSNARESVGGVRSARDEVFPSPCPTLSRSEAK